MDSKLGWPPCRYALREEPFNRHLAEVDGVLASGGMILRGTELGWRGSARIGGVEARCPRPGNLDGE